MTTRLARSAGLIGVATMASRVLGLAHDMVYAALFGAAALLWVTRADLELGRVTFQGWGDLLKGTLQKSPVTDATVALTLALATALRTRLPAPEPALRLHACVLLAGGLLRHLKHTG